MEPIRISSPADAISFMGRSLVYKPKESLFCVAFDAVALGPNLRANLPSAMDIIDSYAKRAAHYFGIDHDASATLIAVFTRFPLAKGH